jgi:hypothetical protein
LRVKAMVMVMGTDMVMIHSQEKLQVLMAMASTSEENFKEMPLYKVILAFLMILPITTI